MHRVSTDQNTNNVIIVHNINIQDLSFLSKFGFFLPILGSLTFYRKENCGKKAKRGSTRKQFVMKIDHLWTLFSIDCKRNYFGKYFWLLFILVDIFSKPRLEWTWSQYFYSK